MNILSISGFFETLDPTELIPPAGVSVTLSIILIVICLLICPTLLYLAGTKYKTAPSPLPNLKTGFRTYFGMGSKAAWDYAQRLAGQLWSLIGAVLAIATVLVCLSFFFCHPALIAYIALITMIVQASATVISWAVISILVSVHYDKYGQLRKK